MGMYRASRAIWPTEGSMGYTALGSLIPSITSFVGIFGDPNKSVDEQVEEIREIFFADLKEVCS